MRVDARRFASCRPLVVGSETTRFFHLTKLFIYCECGCETFRFLSPIGCRKRNNSLLSPENCVFIVSVDARRFASCRPLVVGSETTRFFHLTKLFIYCECGCETFRFLSPIGCRKRNNSLLSPENCVFIVSVDARRFPSCRPLVVGSETTRFFHLTKLFIYCECGCETFRFLSPIGCRKRNNSLLSPDKTVYLL